MSVYPIVTDIDRRWALEQKPNWVRMYTDSSDDVGEIVDDGGWMDTAKTDSKHLGPCWFDFVTGEIESFERFFYGQRKAYAEWSALWRYGWWPKRKEEWTWKHMAKKKTQPFFRKGTQEFAIALRLATEDERAMWVRFGIAQLKPDDPRVVKITEGASRRK